MSFDTTKKKKKKKQDHKGTNHFQETIVFQNKDEDYGIQIIQDTR